MNKALTHSLKAFLCHASGDKPAVREMYKRLVFEGVDAWLDKEKLLPGQDWRVEIPRAVQEADVVIVFLSKKSISKEGYVQKEIKFALDIAEEKPEGTIFLIPARLEDCPVPERLSRWQWVDLFEENGFVQLLRSLKLRAALVDATVEPLSYEESDKESSQRLEQLYTEGLAAFYTEEWDRACQRFQTILSERPSHKNAAAKLAEADKQRSLMRLYLRAEKDYKSENWQAAVQTLEDLLQKSAEYRDAAQLLRNSRKQKRLGELYAEAKTLHTAQKWQAVLKVFEQISAIELNCPDPDGLLPSAQKEVIELKRLADLNDQYSLAVRKLDDGQWLEARTLLEKVHKSQTGFLETERLLRKLEDEITKVEEGNKRRDQINMLYEQAHGLIRSKNWRKALDKIEEIQKLDSQFEDKDGITEQAKAELAREEQEIQRQNELAAMYAESVRLMQEGKYQEALDKWGEVRTIDSKYPDRQWVQRTARKKLAEMTKPVRIKPRFPVTRKTFLLSIGGVLFSALFVSVTIMLIHNSAYPSMRDNFNSVLYDNSYDHRKWMASPIGFDDDIYQQDGNLLFVQKEIGGRRLEVRDFNFSPTKAVSIQADLMIYADEDGIGNELHVITTQRRFICGLQNSTKHCFYENLSGSHVQPSFYNSYTPNGIWHTFLVKVDPLKHSISFYVDSDQAGLIFLEANEELTGVSVGLWNSIGSPAKGYVDNVIIETLDSP